MPGSVTEAWDQAHHLVYHHAFAAGVRRLVIYIK